MRYVHAARVRYLLLAFSAATLAPFGSIRSAAPAEPKSLELPRPNGRYTVGTRVTVLNDAQRHRDLLLTLWYPSSGGGSAPAPYMDAKTAEALAVEWKLKPGFERRVRTHATARAPFAEGDPCPVVLLEHGSGVVPAIYTVLAEGLASSGYVVVAANHTPDSLIAVFPDGHEVRSAPYWPVDADRTTQGRAITRFAETVLVPDARFVLDRLAEMNLHDPFWHGRLAPSRAGIVGHSMGGTTASLAADQDGRIVAGVNLDGSTFPGMNGDVRPVLVHKPYLFLMTEEHATDPGTHGREFAGMPSDTYYIAVAGTDHMSFTDTHLIDSRFGLESLPDDAVFARALLTTQMTRTLVTEFFGKYLKGESAPSLDLVVRVERK
jgi:dienelactone hydrolase